MQSSRQVPSLIARASQHSPQTGPAGLRWRGPVPKKGELFALIATHGYVGLVRIVGLDAQDSDYVRVELVQGSARGNVVAVGPVSGPLERAKLRELSADLDSPSWQPTLALDLDGDGTSDLELLGRCRRYAASGCEERVCSEVCVGTRRAGEQNPSPATIECESFLPDIQQCER